jgi:hypothetical protein
MGKVLEQCETLDAIQQTAGGIEEALRKAIDESITRLELSSQAYDELLVGGDDLVLAVPSQVALPMAMIISEEFSRRCAQSLGLSDATLSAAVVWAHTSFPFGAWHAIAESALSFAKHHREFIKLRRTQQGLPPMPKEALINFLVISSANHLAFDEWYSSSLVSDQVKEENRVLMRTLRPYPLHHLERLLSYRRRLSTLPRGKLAALREAVFQPTPRQAMLDALRVLVHWRDDTLRPLIWELVRAVTLPPGNEAPPMLLFPFMMTEEADAFQPNETIKVYRSVLADLAEIWDVTEGVPHAHE